MQIVEHSVIGTRSAILRMGRRGSGLEFVIFPMVHVAAPEFYHEVTKRLKACDLLVLEGIRGSGRPSRGAVLVRALTFTYRVMPWLQRGRIVLQNTMDPQSLGKPILCPDVSDADMAASFQRLPWRLRAMLVLMVPVVAVANLFGAHRRLLSPAMEVSDLPSPEDEDFADSEFGEHFETFVGGERDDRLIAALAELVRTRSAERIDVAVVYGAQHVPEIVDGLFKLGYRMRPSDWVMVFPA